MTNYDTEIRRIAEEVRLILNNCTDAPRLLREYAGLHTQAEVDKEVANAEALMRARVREVHDELKDVSRSLERLGSEP